MSADNSRSPGGSLPENLWAVSCTGDWFADETAARNSAISQKAICAEFIRMDIHRHRVRDKTERRDSELHQLRAAARAAATALREHLDDREDALLGIGNSPGQAAMAVEEGRDILERLEELL